MTDKQKKELRVALHGMEGRAYKAMLMFLQGPCKGLVDVVEDNLAQAHIIDLSSVQSKQLFEKKLSESIDKPIIILSLDDYETDNALVILVRKPIKMLNMQEALEKASLLSRSFLAPAVKKIQEKVLLPSLENETATVKTSVASKKASTNSTEKSSQKQLTPSNEDKKTAKHKAAEQLTEDSLTNFIGTVFDIDFNDIKQALKANYEPKDYYQGYVQASLKLAIEKGRFLKLESGWKPLIILPHSHEVWLDSNDKQLRAFANVLVNSMSGVKKRMAVKPIDPKSEFVDIDLANFQDMDVFLWKLSLWTSKGRYPQAIDINRPVKLKQWPNFTRFVVTPHAMRISALLIEEPKTLIDVAHMLDVKLQYVFIFISAAHALGLVAQAPSSSSNRSLPKKSSSSTSSSPPRANKRQGLLSKIINKLRH